MAVNTLVKTKTKIDKLKLQDPKMKDFRGGVFEYKPSTWKPNQSSRKITIEPLDEELKASSYYTGGHHLCKQVELVPGTAEHTK